MKIILLLILLIPNFAFAEDFPLFRLYAKNTNPDLDKNYNTLSFLDKGQMNCKTHQEPSKENNFIESQVCTSKGSDSQCFVLIDRRIDKNHKSIPTERYCYSKLDLVTANTQF